MYVYNEILLTVNRERERQHKRDELWVKVENLASKNPSFDNVAKQSQDIEYNNIVNSPEEDGEINIENIEHETPEV